jgi:glutaredoxin
MSDEQLMRLCGVNFRFALKNIDFEERMEQLTVYKSAHGNTAVPVLFTDSNNLGYWCFRMRQKYHKGELAPERFAALSALDFDWSLRRGQNGRSSNNNMAFSDKPSCV